MPELRVTAERILREELGDEVVLTWMTRVKADPDAEVSLLEGDLERVEGGVGYTDGSRMNGVAAEASAEGSVYLGEFATVMDAEMIGIAGAWEEGFRVVASDRQAAISRCLNLASGVQKGGSWIDEKILRLLNKGKGGKGRSLMWVRGHSGV